MTLAPAAELAAAAPALDLTPLIPIAVTAILGLITALIINAARDRAARIPTVAQLWTRMDTLESQSNEYRELLFTVRRVFLAYVSRAKNGGSLELTDEESRALADEPAGK